MQVLFALLQNPQAPGHLHESSQLAQSCPASREKPRGLPWSLTEQGLEFHEDGKCHREDTEFPCFCTALGMIY